MPIRVAIVDDQALVRGGFSMILSHQNDIEVVAECANGVEAIEVAKTLQPDLILMDIRMPEMDGLAASEKILGDLKLPTRILILSTFDLDEYVYKALKLGASGFILKDTPPEQLVTAVRTVAEGGALLAPSITQTLISSFTQSNKADPNKLELLKTLTERELGVLSKLAQGLSNQEISEALFISEATVKTHVSNVLAKLVLRDRAQAVIFAYESGLIEVGSS